MSKFAIVTGKDTPILRTVCEPVKKFDTSLKKTVKGMKKAMEKANGVGIAAPQVGLNMRVFLAVFNCRTKDKRTVPMVNPEITWKSEEEEIDEEGCLSLPGIYGKVARSSAIKVSFFDVEGNRQHLELSGYNARVVQHENDHINGILFIDKLVSTADEDLNTVM